MNTPLFATNATGNVVWRWDRDAFGTIEPDADPDGDGILVDVPLRFPGQIKMPGDGKLTYNSIGIGIMIRKNGPATSAGPESTATLPGNYMP